MTFIHYLLCDTIPRIAQRIPIFPFHSDSYLIVIVRNPTGTKGIWIVHIKNFFSSIRLDPRLIWPFRPIFHLLSSLREKEFPRLITFIIRDHHYYPDPSPERACFESQFSTVERHFIRFPASLSWRPERWFSETNKSNLSPPTSHRFHYCSSWSALLVQFL